MFFQPPDKESANTIISGKSAGAQKSARRKRRKLEQKFKNKSQLLKKEKQRFANSMSSWAENFTTAATWQLKHQVAHWKARAKALEYENNILRTTLRELYVKGKYSQNIEDTDIEAAGSAENQSVVDEEVLEEEQADENDQEDGEETLEVSEEFLDFLRKNAEFRQARDERKRLRKLEEEMPMKLLESCPAGPVDPKAEYEKLYGHDWQIIAAIEMAMESQFISDCDKYKPVHWPVIPLRL